jgi:preprotein translocase subunit Sec61beta
MVKGKVQMPQSTAGLVRYFEESKESIKIKPEYLIVVLVIIIILEIGLKFLF